jgi:hypothetical protein
MAPLGKQVESSHEAQVTVERRFAWTGRGAGRTANISWRARPAWDSNSPDSGQATEIVEVATFCGRWSAGRTIGAAGIERGNSLRWNELLWLGTIGWVSGTEFATGSSQRRKPNRAQVVQTLAVTTASRGGTVRNLYTNLGQSTGHLAAAQHLQRTQLRRSSCRPPARQPTRGGEEHERRTHTPAIDWLEADEDASQ